MDEISSRNEPPRSLSLTTLPPVSFPLTGVIMDRRLLALLLLWIGSLFAPPLSAQEKESTLQRIKREGVLRWGADPSGGAPFAFNNPYDARKIVGFEVELMDRLAKHLEVRPVLEAGKWDLLIDSLKAHRIDLAFNGIEVTDEREQQVLFTIPYFRFSQQLTVRAKDGERFRTLEDLKGRKVAILGGSASGDVLKKAGWAPDLILPFDD